MESRIVIMIREVEKEFPEERRFWMRTCLKRWCYHCKYTNPYYLLSMDDQKLRRRMVRLASRVTGAIDIHMGSSCNNPQEIQTAFHQLEQEIEHIIEQESR